MTTILTTFRRNVVCNQPLAGASESEVNRDKGPVLDWNLPFDSKIS